MVKRVDHIAIAVRKLEQAIPHYEKLFGFRLSHYEQPPGENFRLGFIPVGDLDLELVEPLNPQDGIARYIEKRGEGLHHFCFEVADIRATVRELQAKGVEFVPGRGHPMAFIHPRSTRGVLIELLQKEGNV